ncbi:hypothetical protein CP02DC14_2006B, partial [Chlamydia psittaci 02DC14]
RFNVTSIAKNVHANFS